jgi:hypothetical protein
MCFVTQRVIVLVTTAFLNGIVQMWPMPSSKGLISLLLNLNIAAQPTADQLISLVARSLSPPGSPYINELI